MFFIFLENKQFPILVLDHQRRHIYLDIFKLLQPRFFPALSHKTRRKTYKDVFEWKPVNEQERRRVKPPQCQDVWRIHWNCFNQKAESLQFIKGGLKAHECFWQMSAKIGPYEWTGIVMCLLRGCWFTLIIVIYFSFLF